MITVTIQVKPYLAAYLQSAYAHCTVEGAIRFTKNQNLYSCLLQLTTPRPAWGKTRGLIIIWEKRP